MALPVFRPLRLLRLVTLLSVPHRTIGRMVATALMLSGIAVLGVVTASIASWLVQRVEENTEAAVESAEEPMRSDIQELLAEVAALRQEISELRHKDNI